MINHLDYTGLYAETRPGSFIWDVVKEAIRTAKSLDRVIVIRFNGSFFKITKDTTEESFGFMWDARNREEQQ